MARNAANTIRPAKEPVYHYTSAVGLLGIVENHELWATEAIGMNDMAEVHQGWDFIRGWVAKQDPDDGVMKIVLDAGEPESPLSALGRGGPPGP